MSLYNISIQQLQYFLAVTEHLNFTEAANSLYITQPTLSKQIAVLERCTNTKLFIRNKRSVVLTPAGLLLADRLKEILKDLDDAIDQAKRTDRGYKARLKIGSIEGLETKGFLLKTVEYFKEQYPDVLISFEKHNLKNLRELLLAERLDICLTFEFEVENLNCYEFQHVWMTLGSLIMSTKHPLAGREGLTISDFKDYPFVMLSRDVSPNGYDGIIEKCKNGGFFPNVAQFCPNVDSLLMNVEANIGVAALDANVTLPEGAQIRKIPIEGDNLSVVAVWKRNTLNSAVQLFREMIRGREDFSVHKKV